MIRGILDIVWFIAIALLMLGVVVEFYGAADHQVNMFLVWGVNSVGGASTTEAFLGLLGIGPQGRMS